MKVPFWKMHGAGNDFILLDRITTDTPYPSPATIQRWCQPHTGIGADGLILVQPADTKEDHFRMVFFNPDGGEVGMCGNGARCVARFAFEQGIAPSNMRFATSAGPIDAVVQDDTVTLNMQIPESIQLDQTLKRGDQAILFDFANTGVPHAIVTCDDLTNIDLPTLGKAIRLHADFAPAGTNVDFIRILPDNTLEIRTYERGVEAETLACGTGVAAAAVTCVVKGRISSPVTVRTAGGDTLTITVTQHEKQITKLTLAGPAVHVFHGFVALGPAPYPGDTHAHRNL